MKLVIHLVIGVVHLRPFIGQTLEENRTCSLTFLEDRLVIGIVFDPLLLTMQGEILTLSAPASFIRLVSSKTWVALSRSTMTLTPR